MNRKLIIYERKLADESIRLNKICKSGYLDNSKNMELMKKQKECFQKYMIIRELNNKGDKNE